MGRPRLVVRHTSTPSTDSFKVVVTDYPDDSLVQNINFNVEHNVLPHSRDSMRVKV